MNWLKEVTLMTIKNKHINCEIKKCNSCDRNRRRANNRKFFLTDLYSKIKSRCKDTTSKINLKYYHNKKVCTKEEFLARFLNDKKFIKLHNSWVKSGLVYKFTPSIDRINKNLDYTIDNIQFITHSSNAGKDKEKLPILQYDLNGVFIKEWESKWSVHKTLGIPNGNLVKVCYGERKSAGGYVWKFKSI